MPTRHCNALGCFGNVNWRWNLNNSFLRINFTLAPSDIHAFNKGQIYYDLFHTAMLILLILTVNYCIKIKTKRLKAIQEFWKVSLTLFPATCICPVYGLKEKHHLEEIISLRLKGYCLVQMPWIVIVIWQSCLLFLYCMECLHHAFWDIFIEMRRLRFCKKRLGCSPMAVRSFSLFLCSLDTFVELDKPGKTNFFVKICTIML